MFSSLARTTAAFVARRPVTGRSFVSTSLANAAKEGQAEVVLVGCGAPNRGMGWYHAIQMLEEKYVYYYLFVNLCLLRINLVSYSCGQQPFWIFHIFAFWFGYFCCLY